MFQTRSLLSSNLTTVIFFILILFTGNIYSQSRLYNAVMSDNSTKVKRFIKKGDSPNGSGNPQFIPVIGAAEANLYSMVVLLVENNADVNAQNHIGFTALMEATIQKNHRIVSYLIGKGARLEMRANNGATALMVAVNDGNARGSRILLEAGANPNTSDGNGLTPLMKAMEIGDNVELVKLLAEYNADLNARNPQGQPVIMVYPYRNRILAHKELINLGAEVNIQDRDGRTPLIKAVMEGNLEMVKFLIEKGADRFLKDNAGTSANDYGYTQMEIRQYFETLKQ